MWNVWSFGMAVVRLGGDDEVDLPQPLKGGIARSATAALRTHVFT
jgi:hypothetical protein